MVQCIPALPLCRRPPPHHPSALSYFGRSALRSIVDLRAERRNHLSDRSPCVRYRMIEIFQKNIKWTFPVYYEAEDWAHLRSTQILLQRWTSNLSLRLAFPLGGASSSRSAKKAKIDEHCVPLAATASGSFARSIWK